MEEKKGEFHQKYGPWALVTGASQGIGEEFASQLAAKGLNLVLVARRKDILTQLGQKLEVAYGVQTRSIAIDLSIEDCIPVIEQATRDLEIGLLVSNAGRAYQPGNAFLDNDLTQEMSYVHLNALTPAKLAHVFGKKMVDRGRGGIIFVASLAAFQAMPHLASYTAAKSYVLCLGEALYFELHPKGVDITVLCPGSTDTPSTHSSGGSGIAERTKMGVEPVVSAALGALGRKTTVIPGILNRVAHFYLSRLKTRKGAEGYLGKIMNK